MTDVPNVPDLAALDSIVEVDSVFQPRIESSPLQKKLPRLR